MVVRVAALQLLMKRTVNFDFALVPGPLMSSVALKHACRLLQYFWVIVFAVYVVEFGRLIKLGGHVYIYRRASYNDRLNKLLSVK